MRQKERCLGGISGIGQTHPQQDQGYEREISFERLSLEKTAHPGHPALTKQPKCFSRSPFAILSCLGTQRPLQLWFHGGVTTAQASGRAWHCPCDVNFEEIQNARAPGVMEASTQISKGGLGGQATCSRVKIIIASPWSQSKRPTLWTENDKATQTGLLKPFLGHITPLCGPDADTEL
jgi:hypothetical protein